MLRYVCGQFLARKWPESIGKEGHWEGAGPSREMFVGGNVPHGGCWQDSDGSCQQKVNINPWIIKIDVYI